MIHYTLACTRNNPTKDWVYLVLFLFDAKHGEGVILHPGTHDHSNTWLGIITSCEVEVLLTSTWRVR